MPKLNIQNAEHLIYEDDKLQINVLGGIKIEGLERLRVTLKIKKNDKTEKTALRDSLDLYQDDAVEKIIRKAAVRLEIGTTILRDSLEELTEQLEEYRLSEQQKQQTEVYQPKVLTAKEQKAAETFLSKSDLLKRTNELIGQSGMVGEETNRLLMYIIFTSRKMMNPLHIISLGSSGLGKSHLQEKVGELIPEEDKLELTTLSENAFYYFERKALANKLILIEDLDGAVNSLYPLRELQSKKRISKTIAQKDKSGNQATKHLVVEGPVSVAGCTTKEKLYEDNANRSFLIYLDESQEQDNRIMDYQRAVSAGRINEAEEQEATELLRNCQKVLEAIKVVNPYAPLLKLPNKVFKPRRSNAHYLQFIEAVTFYHQKQRQQKADKETGEIYIETTIEDIEQANQLLKEILLRKSDELSGACRNHLENLKVWLKENKKKEFGNREISRSMRKPIASIKRYHYQLRELDYLSVSKDKKTKKHTYRLTALAKTENIGQEVEKELTKVLEQIKKGGSTSSGVAQSVNEPLKAKNISKKK